MGNCDGDIGEDLKIPFPWFGGKSRAADLIWERFGNVASYIEPFAGSLAVLLARPYITGLMGHETINDLDANVSNFWRSIKNDPDNVVEFADWPINETDLRARHKWLIDQLPAHRLRMEQDPDYFDCKIAGWWVWGVSLWIGQGWCTNTSNSMPSISIVRGGGTSVSGINKRSIKEGDLKLWINKLSARIRYVRICCGDYTRVISKSIVNDNTVSGILLDPPYTEGNMKYAASTFNVAKDAAAWARENGNNPLIRIALCGLEGEHIILYQSHF